MENFPLSAFLSSPTPECTACIPAQDTQINKTHRPNRNNSSLSFLSASTAASVATAAAAAAAASPSSAAPSRSAAAAHRDSEAERSSRSFSSSSEAEAEREVSLEASVVNTRREQERGARGSRTWKNGQRGYGMSTIYAARVGASYKLRESGLRSSVANEV